MQEISGAQPVQTSPLTGQLGGEVNRQQFLQLLVTQLRNQDPFEPMQNEEFLAQLATFTQLEEAQTTNSLLGSLLHVNQADLALGGLSQGASLVGKVVEYIDPATGAQIRGTVYSVFFDPGGVLVEVDGNIVPAGSIVSISTNPSAANGGGNPGAAGTNPNGSGSPTTNGTGNATQFPVEDE